jgi:hypothetical protein
MNVDILVIILSGPYVALLQSTLMARFAKPARGVAPICTVSAQENGDHFIRVDLVESIPWKVPASWDLHGTFDPHKPSDIRR